MTVQHPTSRYGLLSSLVGKPWVANARGPDAWDCFHLTQYVERILFGREMSDVIVPNELSWKTVLHLIETSPEFARWQEVKSTPGMLSHLQDGAIVLMAKGAHAAHLGVWFLHEHSILHVDNPDGVRFDDILSIRAMGWFHQKFYVPKS